MTRTERILDFYISTARGLATGLLFAFGLGLVAHAQNGSINTQTSMPPGTGAKQVNVQNVLNLTLQDYAYDSLAHADFAAASLGRTLVVTQKWFSVSTTALLSNIEMKSSGLIQPAAPVTLTITGATWSSGSGGVATYTVSSTAALVAGSLATITGISPAGFDMTGPIVSVASGTTFTVAVASNPGSSYSSGGSVTAQPVISFYGSFSAPDTQTLDTSLGLAGSIVFAGPAHPAHAEWFGMSPSASPSLNVLALQSALWAFPIVPGGYSGNASQSMYNIPIRYGSTTFGCGSFQVNNTVYLSQGEELRSECGQGGSGTGSGVSSLNLANGTFTSGESFMLEVLLNENGFNGQEGAGGTFNIRITGGFSLYVNGFNNAGGSGLKFYGAEGSYIQMGAIIAFGMRGLIVGDTLGNDGSFIFSGPSDDVHILIGEISGLVGSGNGSPGPGLYMHCQGCSFEGTTHHTNYAGYYSGGAVGPAGTGTVNTVGFGDVVNWVSGATFNPLWTGQPVTINGVTYVWGTITSPTSGTLTSYPGNQTAVAYSQSSQPNGDIWIDHSFGFTYKGGTSECSPRWAEVTGSESIVLDNVYPDAAAGYSGCTTPPSTTAIRISGDSVQVDAWGLCGHFTNAIDDASSLTSSLGAETLVPCSPTFGYVFGRYSNAVQKFPNGLLIGNMSIFGELGSLFIADRRASGGATSVVIPCAAGQTSASLDAYTPSGVPLLQLFCNGAPMQVNGVAAGTYTLASGPSQVPAALYVTGTGAVITDSTTNTFGATISGGGSDIVFAWYNGSAWIVMGGYNVPGPATGVTSAASLISTECVTGAGSLAIQTPSSKCTIDSSGDVILGLGAMHETTHGSNAVAGVSTLVSGTVTVSTTAIGAIAAAGGAGYVVKLTALTCSSCGALSIGTVSAGTSFIINSTNGSDASRVYWEIGYLN